MTFFQEEILEPVARIFRFQKSISCIFKKQPIVLIDIGCGPKIRFFHFAKRSGLVFKKYIGIDPLIQTKVLEVNNKRKNILLYKQTFVNSFPIPSNSVDYVTAHAFIEHVNTKTSKLIFKESLRVLKKGGKFILTTPSPKAQKLLEFLAYHMKLLSKREIAEHKIYFDRNSLLNLVKNFPYAEAKHKYFQMGLNNLLVVTKKQ
jgi:ubiquinone/menaquinone biosynthesis C-methylase UbiE